MHILNKNKVHSPWKIFAVLLVGAFMSLLDVTIVNVALPDIQHALSADSATLEWIVSGYALSLGLLLIPAGRIGDRNGHKWIFISGLAIFTLASLACSIVQNPGEIIAARIIQGVGAGIFTPAITSYIQLLFQGRDRGKAFGIFGAIIGLSSALGPLLGGLLVQLGGSDFGWRLIFLINVPVGLILIPVALRLLPRKEKIEQQRQFSLDPVGIILLALGLLFLLVPLIQGRLDNWPAWTYVSIISAVIIFVILGFWEVRRERMGKTALLATHLLKKLSFGAGSVLSLVYFAAFTSIFFILSILWQEGLGHSALMTGLMVVPFAIGSIIGASNSDKIAIRLGRNILLIGCGMVVTGLLLVVVALHIGGPNISAWLLTLPLLIAGLGNGLFIAPNQNFILQDVERKDAGSASGMLATAQRIGTAIGIAVIGTVFFGNISIKPGLNALQNGFIHAAQVALIVNVCLAAAAFILVFSLPKKTVSRS